MREDGHGRVPRAAAGDAVHRGEVGAADTLSDRPISGVIRIDVIRITGDIDVAGCVRTDAVGLGQKATRSEIIDGGPRRAVIGAAPYDPVIRPARRSPVVVGSSGHVQVSRRIGDHACVVERSMGTRIDEVVQEAGPSDADVGAGHDQSVAHPRGVGARPGSKQGSVRGQGKAIAFCRLARHVLEVIHRLPGLGVSAMRQQCKREAE